MKNAISGALDQKMDLSGPTVDDDIRRLITRYGAAAVKKAAERLTKAKRGRKAYGDWAALMPWIDEDANIWLSGADPFKARSDYAIAKSFADASKGHNHASTMQRIERKLRNKTYGRRWYVLVRAMEISKEGYPYGLHLLALDELSKINSNNVWQLMKELLLGNIEDYRAKWGDPSEILTVTQIEKGALNDLMTIRGLSERIVSSMPRF